VACRKFMGYLGDLPRTMVSGGAGDSLFIWTKSDPTLNRRVLVTTVHYWCSWLTVQTILDQN
jgi:hypothetical protein